MKRVLIIGMVVLLLPLGSSAQTIDEDIDGDGLLNTEEDANGDGIVNTGETDPFNADTDGGGEADGLELQNGRDPLDRTDDMTYDLDNDGLTNGEEIARGTDPSDQDTDGDGINDRDDPFPLEKEYKQDSDNDGLPDAFELKNDLERDKRSDALEDADGDGLSNVEEFTQGTDLFSVDTDQDGVEDGEEVESGDDPLENPCLFLAGPSEVLHDIERHWSKSFVTALQQTKSGEAGPRIISGYMQETGAIFRPDQEISRFELLKIALLSSCIPVRDTATESEFRFTDVRRERRPREHEDAALKRNVIYTAYEHGIVDGYDDGSFRPDAPINRAEALKILFNATKLEAFDDEEYLDTFSDVSASDWFAAYVRKALSYEFVEGYSDGTFRPAANITRAEASKIVLYMMISNPRVNGYIIEIDNA